MKTKKPETKKEWANYRFKSAIECAKNALDGKTEIKGTSNRMEYAMYLMLTAMTELPEILEKEEKP